MANHGRASAPARDEATSANLVGIALFVTAFAVMPLMDAVAKHLSASLPVPEVTWARYFFHFAFLAPMVLYRYGLSALHPPQFPLQVVRGGFLLGATLFFFAAIAVAPIADVLAIAFVSPLLVTLLSPLLLKERVGIYRLGAVLVGFAGTCVIIRPGFGDISVGSMFALGTGLMYAFYSIATRKLAGSAPPMVTLTFTAFLGTAVLSLAMPFYWTAPSLPEIGWMALMGLLGASGHYFFIKAFDYAEASFLAPFAYTEIVMATVVGYVFFSDFPDAWTWTGASIVIASGVFISLRERWLARRPRPGRATPPNI